MSNNEELEEVCDHLLEPIKEMYTSIELLLEKWSFNYPVSNSEETTELDKDIKRVVELFIPLMPRHIKSSGVECSTCNIHGINEAHRHHTNIESIRQIIIGDNTYYLLFCHVCCNWWVHNEDKGLVLIQLNK